MKSGAVMEAVVMRARERLGEREESGGIMEAAILVCLLCSGKQAREGTGQRGKTSAECHGSSYSSLLCEAETDKGNTRTRYHVL